MFCNITILWKDGQILTKQKLYASIQRGEMSLISNGTDYIAVFTVRYSQFTSYILQ